MHRTAPPAKQHQAPNASSDEGAKPSSTSYQFYMVVSFNPWTSCAIVSTILCVFQMRKARLREDRSLGQSHIACKWPSLNPGLLIYQNPDVLFSSHHCLSFQQCCKGRGMCWIVGSFSVVLAPDWRRQERRWVFYTQLCIGSNFPILKVLQQGVHRHYHHLGVGLPLQI